MTRDAIQQRDLPLDLAADHRLLVEAVRQAGAIALGYFGNSPKHWEKSANNPVSEADLAVNDFLRGQLMAGRPNYGWLSEESVDDGARLETAAAWIIDPIDGTSPFIKGVPEFTIAAALAVKGRPVAACIFNPATDELFDAHLGSGLRLNGTVVAVSQRPSPEGAQLLMSKRSFKRAAEPELFASSTPHYVGSIAYRLALVGCGRYDAVVSLAGKSDWDIAAGDLVVREAGGCMTTASGEQFRYNGADTRHRTLVAANPRLHAALVEAFGHAH